MKKIITHHVVAESLHDPKNLERWAKGIPKNHFLPDCVHGKIRKGGKIPVVSTSLFSKTGRLTLPAKVTYDWFNENVVAAPPEKYFNPLLRRNEFYSRFCDASHRVYIPENFAALVPWLRDLGFDEVVIMSVKQVGYFPGMLWRYLPIADRKLPWVICTGVDEAGLSKLAPKLCEPRDCPGSVSIAASRWWLPFAGPAAFNPGYFRGLDISAAMTGFQADWESPDPNTFKGQILMRTQGDLRSRFCDAAFLSLGIWNSRFLRSRPKIFSPCAMEFGPIEINEMRFGKEL